jgi:hypothetical protein
MPSMAFGSRGGLSNIEKLTAPRITEETNTEVRRVMLERYTVARYIQDIGAQTLDHEEGVGTLYRAEIPNDEPLVVVEVINSTPEGEYENGTMRLIPGPDGELPYFKHYFLRVPPATQTAREAVAWTCNMTTSKYRPLMET